MNEEGSSKKKVTFHTTKVGSNEDTMCRNESTIDQF